MSAQIVLIGGGHAHVHVLVALARQPRPGMRVTLVTRDLTTPYSGMLSGVIAGIYRAEQAHIDLVRLAAATGTRLVHAEANGLDRKAKRVLLVDVRGGGIVGHWSGGDLRLRRSKIQPVVRRSFVFWTKGSRRDVCRGGLRGGSAICFQ